MELRNWIGIILIIIGSSLQVAGYYSEPWLRVVSFIIIVIGVFIFATQRYLAYSERDHYAGSSHKNTSLPLMGDIYNVSGQRTGGRTNDSSDGDGGGGD